jgi:hypothetical protein
MALLRMTFQYGPQAVGRVLVSLRVNVLSGLGVGSLCRSGSWGRARAKGRISKDSSLRMGAA